MDQEYEYDPEVEEIDLEDEEVYEGDPDEVVQVDEHGNQDELEEGEALGDDLAPPQQGGNGDA